MVRCNWKGALVLTLAWAGAAQGQQPAPWSPAPGQEGPGRIMTVQEPGKPAQQCRVLKSWPLPGGGVAHEVQSLTTGEVTTIIEGSVGPERAGPPTMTAGPPARPASGGAVVPAAVSVSPTPSVQPGKPVPQPVPAQPVAPPQPVADGNEQAPEYRILQENGRPPMKCKVLKRWLMADGMIACHLQSLDTGEMLTIIETGPPTAAATSPPGMRLKEVAARVFHWGRYKTPPPGTPLPPDALPPVVAQCPTCAPAGPCGCSSGSVVVEGPVPQPVKPAPTPVASAPPKSGFFSRIHNLFAGKPSPPSTQVAQAPVVEKAAQPAPVKVVEKPAPVTVAQAPPKPAIEAPGPSDWRQSWDDSASKSPAPVKTAEKKTEGAPGTLAITVQQESPTPTLPAEPKKAPPQTAKLPPPAAPPQTAKLPPPAAPPPPASVLETTPKRDPLVSPEDFASRRVEQKVPGFKSDPLASAENKAFTPPPAIKPTVAPMPPLPPTPTPTPTAPAVNAALPTPAGTPDQGKVPLGSASVLAANNGLERPVRYVPVPVVTVPEPKQAPLPPIPQIPQAPQPNDKFVNAFSPPPMPQGQGGAPQGYPTPYGMPGMAPQGMMAGYPPMMGQPGMAAGYPQQMPMGGYYNPGYAPMAQRPQLPMPYGYPPQAMYPQGPNYGYPQAMYPGNGYSGPMAQAGAFTLPAQMVRGTVPYGYQGPQAPNPFQQPMPYPYGYPPAMGWQGGQPRNPAMDRPAMPAGPSANQAAANDAIMEMVNVLKTSTYPSQREWAANNLAGVDARSNPLAVQALLAAAKEDPAPTVRAGCVHGLSRMQVTADPVVALMQQLKGDADPRVRVEAERALARLSPAAPQSAVQQAGGVAPGR